MSMLNKVTKGKMALPHLLLLYGPDGVGKSTFGSQAPNPIFLGPEKGTMNLDVSRFPTPENWGMVVQALDELRDTKHDYETLVIDTLDWMEPLVYKKICEDYGVNSIEKAAAGYGKGYREAFNEMCNFRDKLSFLRENKGMNIILLAHSTVTTFEDPSTDHGYDRYELKLQESKSISMRAMWREYVDSVLFCNSQTFTKGEGKQARGITTSQRMMWTTRQAAYDAKNRFGLPEEMPLDFPTYAKAVGAAESNPETEAKAETAAAVTKRLNSTLKNSKLAEDLAKKVSASIKKAGKDLPKLYAIEKRLKTIQGEING